MAKLIKRGSTGSMGGGVGGGNGGDITPDTGLPDLAGSRKVISGKAYEAKTEAQIILERAEADAQRIIDDAQGQADQIMQTARAEAEQLKEQMVQQGYDEGRTQGAAELTEVVTKASLRLQAIEAQVVPQLNDLAIAIARRILGKELEFHPEGVVDIVKQALSDKARQRREIFLRVNPDDLDQIREAKPQLLEVLSRCKEIGLREDPDVERYGVVIETDAGIIDAQLETQLAVLERVLKSVPA